MMILDRESSRSWDAVVSGSHRLSLSRWQQSTNSRPRTTNRGSSEPEEDSTHKSVMTHAGNVTAKNGKSRRSAAASAARKWRRENPVSLAWLMRRGIAAGKTQRTSPYRTATSGSIAFRLKLTRTCFCASWHWHLTDWPKNQSVSRIRREAFLCQVWWSWLHRFLRYRVKNKHINAAKNRTPVNAVGVGN